MSHIPPEKASFSFHWGVEGGAGGGRGEGVSTNTAREAGAQGILLLEQGYLGDGDREMETSLRGDFS